MLLLFNPCLQIFDFSLPSYCLSEYTDRKEAVISAWIMYGFGKMDFYDDFVRNTHVTLEARLNYKKLMDHDALDKYYHEEDYVRPEPPDGKKDVWNTIKERLLDPYFAPGMAENLQGIPNTYIVTAGKNPFSDEGVIFAQRLDSDGGTEASVYHEQYDTIEHGQVFQYKGIIDHLGFWIKLVLFFKYICLYLYSRYSGT